MKLRWLLQVSLLGLALVSTIAAMSLLKGNHTSSFLASLGFSSSQLQKLNWCESRVKTVSLKGSTPITEINHKWVIKAQSSLPLDYISFEKWLAKFCLLTINPANNENNLTEPMGTLFDVEYINGKTVQIYRLGKDKFQIGHNIFRSSSLEKLMPAFSNFLPPELRPKKTK